MTVTRVTFTRDGEPAHRAFDHAQAAADYAAWLAGKAATDIQVSDRCDQHPDRPAVTLWAPMGGRPYLHCDECQARHAAALAQHAAERRRQREQGFRAFVANTAGGGRR